MDNRRNLLTLCALSGLFVGSPLWLQQAGAVEAPASHASKKVAQKKGSTSKENLPSFGVFPLAWLDSVDEVYPITSAPEDVQWEAWLAVKTSGQGRLSNPVVIEVFGGTESAGVKVKKYLVEHHKFSARQFEIKFSQNAAWNGYVVVRGQDTKLPEVPVRPPQLSHASPIAAIPEIQTRIVVMAPEAPRYRVVKRVILSDSLLSPFRTVEDYVLENPQSIAQDMNSSTGEIPITTSQASPYSPSVPQGRLQTYASKVQAGWLGSFGPQYRPSVSMEWFDVEGAKNFGRRTKAGWIGARVQGEVALLRWSIGEVGVGASAFHSLNAITPDARQGSAVDAKAQAHVLLHANSTAMGIPMLKLSTGYEGNWRNAGANSNLLPAFQGFRVAGELSTFVDHVFTLGASSAYTFAQSGIVELGGSVSHRLIQNERRCWDARLGVNAASAKGQSGAAKLEETWTSVQIGLTGTL
ncbi:MAG: hypothetical protein H7222_09015 [Methylotenera sp.]|nr:hypothetical protein [Oligoflexia bacterium]